MAQAQLVSNRETQATKRRVRAGFARLLRRSVMGIAVLAFVAALGVSAWYFLRPQPTAVQNQALFAGVSYTRTITRDPRPMIVHRVTVDLQAAGLGFVVTPGDAGAAYRARTTSEFLTEFGVQVAINGDFFDIERGDHPNPDDGEIALNAGDLVMARGFAASMGEIVTQGYVPPARYRTLYLSADNRAAFDTPTGAIYNAISGHVLLQDGAYVQVWRNGANMLAPQPRTAVGLDAAGGTLYLVVVDGRQPNYSDGMRMEELAELLRAAGAHNAINLDGGGSAALVIAHPDGTPNVLNSPIHSRIPGNERPAANHLGIFALPADDN